MKRNLTVAALFTATAFLATGCASGGGSGSSDSGGDAGEATGTLRVVVPNFSADNEGQAVFQSIVDVFHETYPNMDVQPDFVPYDNLNQKISTSLASGQGYDVVSAGVGWVQPLADLGALQSLDPMGVTQDELEESVYPSFVPPVLFDDEVYAIPIVANPRLLAYSKSAFEAAGLDPAQPPKTLEELREYAQKLTIRDASGNITQTGFDFWAPPSNYRQQFVNFFGSLGGQMFDGEEPTFNTDAGVEALTTIKEMVSDDKTSLYGFENTAKTSLVSTGEAAMGFASPYVDCTDAGIGAKCDDLEYFLLEDPDGEPVMYTGGRVAGVGGDTENPEAALAFVRAMQDPSVQEKISAMDVGVPISIDAADSDFVKSNPASTFATEHLGNTVSEYGGATFLDFRAEFGPSLDAVILGDQTAEDALSALEQVALQ